MVFSFDWKDNKDKNIFGYKDKDVEIKINLSLT